MDIIPLTSPILSDSINILSSPTSLTYPSTKVTILSPYTPPISSTNVLSSSSSSSTIINSISPAHNQISSPKNVYSPRTNNKLPPLTTSPHTNIPSTSSSISPSISSSMYIPGSISSAVSYLPSATSISPRNSTLTSSSVDERFDAPRLRALRDRQHNKHSKYHKISSLSSPLSTSTNNFIDTNTSSLYTTRTTETSISSPPTYDHASLERELLDDEIDKWLGIHETRPKWYFNRFQRLELKKFFKLLDIDGSGEIDISELEGPLLSTGLVYNQATLEALVKRIDKDHSGEIDYYEFLDAFKPIEARQEGRINKEDALQKYKYKQQQLLRGKVINNDQDHTNKPPECSIVFQDLLKLLTNTNTSTTDITNSPKQPTGRTSKSTINNKDERSPYSPGLKKPSNNDIPLNFEEIERLKTQKEREKNSLNAEERLLHIRNQPIPTFIQQSLGANHNASKKGTSKSTVNANKDNKVKKGIKQPPKTVPTELTMNNTNNMESIPTENVDKMNQLDNTLVHEDYNQSSLDNTEQLDNIVSMDNNNDHIEHTDTSVEQVIEHNNESVIEINTTHDVEHINNNTNILSSETIEATKLQQPVLSPSPISPRKQKLHPLGIKHVSTTSSSPATLTKHTSHNSNTTSSTTNGDNNNYQNYLSIPTRVSQYRRKFLLQLLITDREIYNQTKYSLQQKLTLAKREKNTIEINGLLDDIRQLDQQQKYKLERMEALVNVIENEKQHVQEYLHQHQSSSNTIEGNTEITKDE